MAKILFEYSQPQKTIVVYVRKGEGWEYFELQPNVCDYMSVWHLGKHLNEIKEWLAD